MAKLKNSTQTYKRLLKFTRKYWSMFMVGLVGTAVLSMVDAALTWLIKPIINQGFVNRDLSFIRILPFLVIVLFALRGVGGFASNYFINRVARNVVRDFRREIFKKLLRLPANFYDRNSSGHLLSAIIYNVEQVAQASSEALLTILRESTFAIGLVAVMFIASWEVSLLFMFIAPFLMWVVKKTSQRMRRLSSNVQQAVGDVTHVADEGIQGYKVIRLYGGQEYEYKKFHQATKANQQRELKIVVTNSIGTAIVQLLIAIPIAITLLFATLPSLQLSAGSFAAIIAAMISLLRPLRRLTNVNSMIQKGVAGAESIFIILDETVEKDQGTLLLNQTRGDIEFQEVTFRYDTNKNSVLKNISFQVNPGQTVAIVGRSGAGKSTLINLLPRFYDVTSGAIKIGGNDIREYQLAELRNQFALVEQNTVLFDDTVANNIAYGLSGKASEAEIIKAAEAAHVMEFVRELPQGLQTLIGEDGLLLSGGQRQRIAIARAILKNAPILILDEATSALDTQSERHIQNALENLMSNRTTLVIAHRLSTVENADWIVVLESGVVVEQGTHQQLLQRHNVYANLYRMQFKDKEQSVPAEII